MIVVGRSAVFVARDRVDVFVGRARSCFVGVDVIRAPSAQNPRWRSNPKTSTEANFQVSGILETSKGTGNYRRP